VDKVTIQFNKRQRYCSKIWLLCACGDALWKESL